MNVKRNLEVICSMLDLEFVRDETQAFGEQECEKHVAISQLALGQMK